MTFEEWWNVNGRRYSEDACHMSEYHMAKVLWDAALQARPEVAAVEWVDEWECKNSRTPSQAAQELKELYDEWPCGLEEIESSLQGHRSIVLESVGLLRNAIAGVNNEAAVAWLEKHKEWFDAISKREPQSREEKS